MTSLLFMVVIIIADLGLLWMLLIYFITIINMNLSFGLQKVMELFLREEALGKRKKEHISIREKIRLNMMFPFLSSLNN